MTRLWGGTAPLTKGCAEAEAASIREFWRAKGREVAVTVDQVTVPEHKTGPIYIVRSDMVNGFPRRIGEQ